MRILSLDLGTTTGWAIWHDGRIVSGSWLLATARELKAQKAAGLDRCCDMRPAILRQQIEGVLNLDWIYFEDVQFLSSQLQTQLWASLRAMIQLKYPSVKVAAIPVGTIKKFAGHGQADKEHMAIFLNRKHPTRYLLPDPSYPKRVACIEIPGRRAMDDNEVDALHLLDFALNELDLQNQ